MQLRFVCRILPVFVIFKNWIVKKDCAGRCWGLICIIRPEYAEDGGLIQHELVHCKQWYKGLGIYHWLMYAFSDRYKLKSEVEAYRWQLEFYDDTFVERDRRTRLFAEYIAHYYNLDITEEEAYNLLKE